jgi:hypothetical protein
MRGSRTSCISLACITIVNRIDRALDSLISGLLWLGGGGAGVSAHRRYIVIDLFVFMNRSLLGCLQEIEMFTDFLTALV